MRLFNKMFVSVVVFSQLAACLPMGLPEVLTDAAPQLNSSVASSFRSEATVRTRRLILNSSQRQRALLILSEQGSDFGISDSSDETLGHQYLLGIIPFTRLFFEHGRERTVNEVMLRALREQGYQTYFTSQKHRAAVERLVVPNLVVEAETKALDVNAYDAIFFRIVSVSGRVDLKSVRRTGRGFPIERMTPVSLDTTKMRRYAYAPILSYAVEKELLDGFRDFLSEPRYGLRLGPVRRSRSRKRGRGEQEPVVLVASQPSISGRLSQEFADRIDASYGYRGLQKSSSAMLESLLQRGMANGVAESDMPVVFSLAGAQMQLAEDRLWGLESQAKIVSLGNGQTRLQIEFTLHEQLGGHRLKTETHCEIDVEEAVGREASWVVGLEQAASRLMSDFLNGENTSTCHRV